MAPTAQPAPADAALTETRVPVMGAEAHIVCLGARAGTLQRGVEALHELERRWSRFRPDSEISRLNAAGGRPVAVSPATTTLVSLAVEGWQATGGRYDPTVLDAMIAAGYDRSFSDLHSDSPTSATPAGPTPGCDGMTVDHDRGIVQLPPAVHLDPGGIGKGLAADLVAAMLRADGAAGALVNVGGDIRVIGEAPPAGWGVDVDLPGIGDTRLALRDAGVATSGTHRRRWRRDGTERHHLVDPVTGSSAVIPFVGATVVAGSAWWAEILTKAVLLAGSVDDAARTVAGAGAAGLLVDHHGQLHPLADVERFLR
jgi:FAD:protein FMN transferase